MPRGATAQEAKTGQQLHLPSLARRGFPVQGPCSLMGPPHVLQRSEGADVSPSFPGNPIISLSSSGQVPGTVQGELLNYSAPFWAAA